MGRIWNSGLIDLPGRGRPSILTDNQKNNIVKRVKKSPRSLKSVLADLEVELGITVSIDTIKLICKQAGLVWKRVRKSLRTKRNQKDFDVAQENIKELIQQHKDNQLNLCYFDESGSHWNLAFLMHGNCQIKQSKFLARKVNGSMYWALLTEIVNLIHLSSRERLIPQSWWLVLMNFLRT